MRAAGARADLRRWFVKCRGAAGANRPHRRSRSAKDAVPPFRAQRVVALSEEALVIHGAPLVVAAILAQG
jgi:hypothetical protein